MPFGLAASTSGVPASQYCAPPSWFRGVAGVRAAWPHPCGPFSRTPSLHGSKAQRTGKRYERKALAHLSEVCGDRFRPSPWFKFEDDTNSIRWCQPDAILHTQFATVIFEIKYSFTSDAWWQLRHLYEPVIRKVYARPIAVVVVCKSFDPAVPFPEKYALLPRVDPLHGNLERDCTHILVWRP